jgi:hypothetical protein
MEFTSPVQGDTTGAGPAQLNNTTTLYPEGPSSAILQTAPSTRLSALLVSHRSFSAGITEAGTTTNQAQKSSYHLSSVSLRGSHSAPLGWSSAEQTGGSRSKYMPALFHLVIASTTDRPKRVRPIRGQSDGADGTLRGSPA